MKIINFLLVSILMVMPFGLSQLQAHGGHGESSNHGGGSSHGNEHVRRGAGDHHFHPGHTPHERDRHHAWWGGYEESSYPYYFYDPFYYPYFYEGKPGIYIYP